MSRHLPPHPNLDHLRKQAKDLLRERLQHDPAAQLADAQHALARDYGFASWPKLRAHLESLRPHPLSGAWAADLSRSTRHPANLFRSARLQIEVAGDLVNIADVVVDDAGHPEPGSHSIRADGLPHPSDSGNGYVVTAAWRGERVLETVATRDGRVVGRGSYEVSPDGKTLTVMGDQQRIVLDRVAAEAAMRAPGP